MVVLFGVDVVHGVHDGVTLRDLIDREFSERVLQQRNFA